MMDAKTQIITITIFMLLLAGVLRVCDISQPDESTYTDLGQEIWYDGKTLKRGEYDYVIDVQNCGFDLYISHESSSHSTKIGVYSGYFYIGDMRYSFDVVRPMQWVKVTPR